MFELPAIDDIIISALAEDLGVSAERLAPGANGHDLLGRDVTGASTLPEDAVFAGAITARESCVVAGLPVAAFVFELLADAVGLGDAVDVFPLVAEGTRVEPGTAVAEIEGSARLVLAAERTALDFMMILAGIATETALWVERAGDRMQVCDTRKTVPGLRALSKYAVRVGGGANHRMGVYDMVLVKDNHIVAAGGIEAAVRRARMRFPDLRVEVEADTIEQAAEAVRVGADIILLDNMDDDTLTEAVAVCRKLAEDRGRPVLTEASGGITRDRVPLLRMTGVDRVSTSAITLARPVDFGLDESSP